MASWRISGRRATWRVDRRAHLRRAKRRVTKARECFVFGLGIPRDAPRWYDQAIDAVRMVAARASFCASFLLTYHAASSACWAGWNIGVRASIIWHRASIISRRA